jgi:alanine racemase
MSRNGLEVGTEAGMAEALKILQLPDLNLVGIMTHFPVEEEGDVRKSLGVFNAQSATLIERGRLDRSKITLHVANSFATIMVPDSRLDMVRTGGAIYGDTVANSGYEPIATRKTEVAGVMPYPAGNTVAYDRTFKLTRPSILANIPVGYSDGYRRVFSNGNVPPNPPVDSVVLIHGRKVPVVGRITMNTFMVDVTDLDPPVRIGDEVVLVGRQADAIIRYGDLEPLTKSIAADLYTVWGNSQPKVLVP